MVHTEDNTEEPTHSEDIAHRYCTQMFHTDIAHREQAEQRAQRRRVEIMKSAGDEEPHVQMTDEGIRTHISYHTSRTNTHVCTQNYRVNLRQSNWTMPGMIHNA